MAQIVEVPKNFGDKAKKIKEEAKQLSTAYRQLNALADNSKNTISDSRDSDTVAVKLTEASLPLVDIANAMTEYADLLQKIGKRYQNARRDAVKRAKNISR